jgi:hypothetical protein
MNRRAPRRRPVPPGKRPSKLPACTYAAGDPATAPGPDQPPNCAVCGLPESHGRHHQEASEAVLQAQAEHRRRTGEREEDPS